MAIVTFEAATRTYPNSHRPAVDGLDLEVRDGEFLVLVGPSGCGKTTTLRMLAGLENVDAGDISIDGKSVVNLAPRDRDIAMVFQNYALYPHMSVAQNMGFALRMAKVPKSEIDERVRAAAKILDIEEYLERKPRQLSGGQRQRVAMGRAIVRQPRVFLMDEPLSNLDAKLRVATRAEIAALQRNLGVTTLYVTHDQVEAMTMGDRVAVMKDGVLQQCDTPRALYDEPANVFVGGFIGSPSMNLLEGTVGDGGVRLGSTVIPVTESLPIPVGAPVTVGLRPESLALAPAGGGIPARVSMVEELGAEAFVHARPADGVGMAQNAESMIVARFEPRTAPATGELIHLRAKDGSMLLFDASSGDRIRARS
ncbi:MAG TPA: sn-glycerol-3-phosphate ABC transporter ATP-binding protein UgpC [Gaiellaceae bacterium]|nr:sn-glycerol-3-phosphate ABC transporter ATP-binding protein UgpC [Gaiellaceae bacterium]